MPWVKFSPFFPHGGIPIPFSQKKAESVEGVWQGLKVFEKEGIDEFFFYKTDMKNMKRGGKKRGNIIGHQLGTTGKEILAYTEAKLKIYLPFYTWVLNNKLHREIHEIINFLDNSDVIFLDYNTSEDFLDTSKPLSHAAITKRYIENIINNIQPSPALNRKLAQE